MVYRKKYVDKFILRYKIAEKSKLSNKLILSFKKNYNVCYKKRIGLFINKLYTNKDNRFYNSQNKAVCFMTYSPKVPNANLNLSRFYLVKHSNSLLLSGFQK